MKDHSYYFDEKLSKLTRNEACGLPKDAGMNKGKIGTGKTRHGDVVLSEKIKDAIQQKWNEVVEPVTGCKTYNELRAKLRTME
jgi:hypothetical protein